MFERPLSEIWKAATPAVTAAEVSSGDRSATIPVC
jgi:hypothetical protein